MTKLLLKKANLQVLLIEREKKCFFSISEQHEISLVHCAMVGSQKSRSCLGAELVSQLSKFLKNRGSTRNSNHSTKSFVFSSQNISEHLTTSWYISFVLFRFFFLIYLRSSVKLEFLKASQHQNSTRFVEVSIFFRTYIHTLSLSCLCQEFCKRKGQSKVLVEKTGKKTSRVLNMVRVRDSNSWHNCFKSIHHNMVTFIKCSSYFMKN